MVNRIKNAYYTFKNFHGDCITRIKLAFRVWKAYREEMLVIIQRAYRDYKNLSPFYDFRMDNESVMRGNKQRNRLSMASVRKFYGDYLDMRNQRHLLDAMGPGSENEKVCLVPLVLKVGFSLKHASCVYIQVLFSSKAKSVVHPGFLGAPKLSPRYLCLTEQVRISPPSLLFWKTARQRTGWFESKEYAHQMCLCVVLVSGRPGSEEESCDSRARQESVHQLHRLSVLFASL